MGEFYPDLLVIQDVSLCVYNIQFQVLGKQKVWEEEEEV